MNLTTIESSHFTVNTKQADYGTVTKITVEHGISVQQQINTDTRSIIAAHLYDRSGSYKVIYLVVDHDGLFKDSFIETEGILPSFFKAPDNTIWVSVIPYHPDKEMEISIPLFERSSVEVPKSNRPFVGDFIGTNQDSSFFISNDIFSTNKPDKFLRIEFKEGKIKKKYNLKIELPSQNKAIISDNQIHLITEDKSKLVYRIIDEKGITLEQKAISFGKYNCFAPLSLSSTAPITVIATKKKSIYLVTSTSDNKTVDTELINLGHEIYSLWDGIVLSPNTVLFRFTYEFGNGWFIIRDNTMIECFISKNNTEYQDLIQKIIIDLGIKDLILSEATKTEDNAFALTFYPRSEKLNKNKRIVLLNRKI